MKFTFQNLKRQRYKKIVKKSTSSVAKNIVILHAFSGPSVGDKTRLQTTKN